MTNTGLLLYDFLKGTHVRKTMRLLERSQHWRLEKLKSYQAEKLERLWGRILMEVPYYRSPATGYRLPENMEMGRLEDMPVLDRYIVMEVGNDLISDKIDLKKCKIGRTGGTTGPPLRLYRDTETRSWALAAYYRFYSWMGIEPGMREVELWGSTVIQNPKSKIQNPKLRTQNYLNRFRGYNAFNFNDKYLEYVAKDIQKFRPKLIRGYLSAIILLAEYIRRNNIKGINPIAVSCTSETLFPEYRKMIEEVFQAPLFDQYGCGECNSIAFECKAHNGLHITMEHCMLETDADNNFIVTNLDNYSQPFIRYRNGDVGIIDESPCSCGNVSPRITELHGRVNENVILKDGSSVNGIFFANLFDQAGYINNNKLLRFQLIQESEGELLFNAEVKLQMGKEEEKRLKDTLMPFFNTVDIKQQKFLDPGPSGKFRYIISRL